MKILDCLGIFELEISPLKTYAMSALRASYRFALFFHIPISWCYSVARVHILLLKHYLVAISNIWLHLPKRDFKYFGWLYY